MVVVGEVDVGQSGGGQQAQVDKVGFGEVMKSPARNSKG
jgi:hypothetical protein